LGGVTIEGYFLPGHTDHSMGYLLRERRLLLAGDAVTPCMCLFFPENLPIADWRQTLDKMGEMPFDTFRIGHYSHEFSKDDLRGFIVAADYALSGARSLVDVHLHRGTQRVALHLARDADGRCGFTGLSRHTSDKTNIRPYPPAKSITRLQNTAATALISDPTMETRE
jgi:glyoxylase-like metal-dependent hydrolase (beta-lactamase superfamily II)